MNADRLSTWTRRDVLRRMSALGAGSLLGLAATPAVAEPPPEVSTLRLVLDPDVPVLCYAPQYVAEEFLHLEGFTDIQYALYGDAVTEHQIFATGAADMSASLASDLVVGIDQDSPITVLTGLHAGCVEVFANDRVPTLRDLSGKRIAVLGEGGPEHIFLSSVVAYIGLDPARDIEWVAKPYGEWTKALVSGEVDVVSAFPPLNLEIREKNIGHVILNTTIDDPWRHFFCCMVSARRDFVRENPIATKRAVRAFLKANQFCTLESERAARLLVERGVAARYEHALKTLREVPYGAWRTHDPEATLRFLALRLREAGLVRNTPREIIARGTDFRFLNEIRRELKV